MFYVTHPQSQAIVEVDIVRDMEVNDKQLILSDVFLTRLRAEWGIEMDEMFESMIWEEAARHVAKLAGLVFNGLMVGETEEGDLDVQFNTRIPSAYIPGETVALGVECEELM